MTGQKIMTILLAALGLLVASALVPGNVCSDTAITTDEKGITVRVLLFSGRPDPTYELGDMQLIERLKASIAEAKRIEGYDRQTVIPANIGYKGILVSNPEKRGGLPAKFAVYKGTIELMDEQKRFLEDKGGAVEKMLLDEAIRKGVIDDIILKRMRSGGEKR